jgi:hypothetical protein
MMLKVFASLAVLAGFAVAQTPEGFTPKVDTHLEVMFGTKNVDPAGMTLTKAGEWCRGGQWPALLDRCWTAVGML